MAGDRESRNDGATPSRARRIRDWLVRPSTVRILGPATFLLGLTLVAIGLLLVPSSDSDRSAVTAPGPTLVPATAYPVPADMAEARRYLVPPVQPSAGFRLVIDSLGVNAPVVRLGLDPRDVPQVPNDGAKVAWYDFSAKPGTGGNAVLAGHVRWAGDPGVLAELDELQEGDIIRLRWRDGRELVYEVSDNLLIDASHPDALRVMAPTPVDTITLFTCAGTFVPDANNPLGGDFTERVIVQARLEEPSAAALSP